jgi:hypothetical protein
MRPVDSLTQAEWRAGRVNVVPGVDDRAEKASQTP